MTTLPGFYKVQRIVGKKVTDGKTLYRVKWLNWPTSTNTYEPVQNLQSAIDLVREYQDKAKQREKQRNSTSSCTTLHTETKPPSPEKNRIRIRKRRAQTIGKRPIIFLKTTQRIGTYWVFGNNLAKIIRRRENGKMMVEWDNGNTSLESEKDIQLHEPELLERFLNPQAKTPRNATLR